MAKSKNRIRKSVKYTYIVIAIIILLISSANLIQSLFDKSDKFRTQEIYKYTSLFNYDYNVELIENKYIKKDFEDKSTAFMTDLIDFTDLNLNYKYVATKSSNLNCTYYAKGRLNVVYTKDGNPQNVWQDEEIILPEKSIQESAEELNIQELIKLDLKEKNSLINEFKQELGISVDAKYIVTFYVNVNTNIENEPVNEVCERTVEINLGEKTTSFEGKNFTENSKYISKKVNVGNTINMYVVSIDGVFIVIALIMLAYALNVKPKNRIKNDYRKELNRILKTYEDKIVQTTTKPIDKEEIITVKEFMEIVKVSEELFKPILYYFNVDEEEGIFSVICGDSVYRYILKK